MSDRIFISDLHLTPDRPSMIDLFLRFMDEVAVKTDELYILGDFLEYWIGDDMQPLIADTPLVDVFDSIKQASDSGVTIYLMHGNRDFLIGESMAGRYGFRIIPDPTTIEIAGEPVLLMHGDTLCTDDVDYLQFRRMVRDPVWLEDFLSKSIEERIAIADELRKKSKEAITDKKPEIMDVNLQEVERTMKEHAARNLIHGHTHRNSVHELTLDGITARRYVLADWYENGGYLEVNGDNYTMRDYCL